MYIHTSGIYRENKTFLDCLPSKIMKGYSTKLKWLEKSCSITVIICQASEKKNTLYKLFF